MYVCMYVCVIHEVYDVRITWSQTYWTNDGNPLSEAGHFLLGLFKKFRAQKQNVPSVVAPIKSLRQQENPGARDQVPRIAYV